MRHHVGPASTPARGTTTLSRYLAFTPRGLSYVNSICVSDSRSGDGRLIWLRQSTNEAWRLSSTVGQSKSRTARKLVWEYGQTGVRLSYTASTPTLFPVFDRPTLCYCLWVYRNANSSQVPQLLQTLSVEGRTCGQTFPLQGVRRGCGGETGTEEESNIQGGTRSRKPIVEIVRQPKTAETETATFRSPTQAEICGCGSVGRTGRL